MKRTVILIWGTLLLLAMGSDCESDSVSTETDPEELPSDVSFSDDIQPIFNGSCGGSLCHINNRRSGVRLDNYENVINSEGNQYGGLIVVPDEPNESPLVDKLEPNPDIGIRMPQTGSPLSQEQINLIKGWIAEGAPDN